jgi:hypothetical protein
MGYPNFKESTVGIADSLHVQTELTFPSAEEAGCTTLETLTFT